MTAYIDFLIPRRPLSHQSKDTKHKEEWKQFVYSRAFAAWKHRPLTDCELKFVVVYLCEQHPIDINNIIKPIEDALNALVYADDNLIIDICGHLRLLSKPIDIIDLPPILAEAVIGGVECVYVQVAPSRALNTEIRYV